MAAVSDERRRRLAAVNAPPRDARPTPPHSEEAEQSVLGAILLDNEALPRVADLIGTQSFYRHDHQAIYAALLAMHQAGEPMDPITVADFMRRQGMDDDAGGLAYLNSLQGSIPSARNVRRYAELVARYYVDRCAAAGMGELGNIAHDTTLTAADKLARAEQAVAYLRPLVDASTTGPHATRFATFPDGRIEPMLASAPAPRDEFIAGRIPAGRACLLAAAGGTSKTRLQYHLGAGAAIGRLPWGWTVQRTGSAALFLAEDTAHDVHHALHALSATLSPEERDVVAHRLRVYPLAGLSPIMLALQGQSLKQTPVYDWFMRQVEALPAAPVFIALDPALGLTEGDELNPAHQRRLGELVDQLAITTGAAVMLTAHTAKGMRNAEELDSHSARGSGALTDAVRAEFTMRTMTADEAKRYGVTDLAERKAYVQLAATKGNHMPPEAFVPVWLRRGEGGTLSEAALEVVKADPVGERELRALGVLKAHAGRGDSTMKFWREQCVLAGVLPRNASQAALEKSMERVRDTLRLAGFVAPGRFRGSWVPTDQAADFQTTTTP